MEIDIEKCAMFIMKGEKREITEGTELPYQETIRKLGERENCQYLEILEMDTIKEVEMKEKKKIEKYHRRKK